jgi:hypothetical protein
LLRGELVFVQQFAEPFATAEVIELQRSSARRPYAYRRRFRERRLLVK